MGNTIKDLTGQKFSSYTVIGLSDKRGEHNEIYWVCKCDLCGNIRFLTRSGLHIGKRGLLCVCSKRVTQMDGYEIWINMKRRCFNPNNERYNKTLNIS